MKTKVYGRIIYKTEVKNHFFSQKTFDKYYLIPYDHFYDELEIIKLKEGQGFYFQCTDPDYDHHDNVIIQASQNFFTIYPDLARDVKIIYHKKASLKYDLGLELSAAITCLKSLYQVYEMELNEDEIYSFSVALSSGASFFVGQKPLILRSDRSRLYRMPKRALPRFSYNIIPVEGIKISEDQVKLRFNHNAHYYQQNSIPHFNDQLVNDYELAIYDVYPELLEQYSRLTKKYLDVMVTGFGDAFIAMKKE